MTKAKYRFSVWNENKQELSGPDAWRLDMSWESSATGGATLFKDIVRGIDTRLPEIMAKAPTAGWKDKLPNTADVRPRILIVYWTINEGLSGPNNSAVPLDKNHECFRLIEQWSDNIRLKFDRVAVVIVGSASGWNIGRDWDAWRKYATKTLRRCYIPVFDFSTNIESMIKDMGFHFINDDLAKCRFAEYTIGVYDYLVGTLYNNHVSMNECIDIEINGKWKLFCKQKEVPERSCAVAPAPAPASTRTPKEPPHPAVVKMFEAIDAKKDLPTVIATEEEMEAEYEKRASSFRKVKGQKGKKGKGGKPVEPEMSS